MKCVSVFSGIGGFEEAFRRAGIEFDSICEIDKAAQMILTRHFPEAILFDDIRKVGKDTHERKSIDLICGGFPCQDLSIAGKGAGLSGERSGLWFEFARVIDELEPRWVVIENVPGLLSSNKGKDFAVIVQWLAERGYGVAWRVLDAQYFGVPQRRRRVFIVGSFGNGCAAEVLFESEGGAGDSPPRRETGQTTPRVSGTLSATSGNGKTQQGNELDFCIPVANTLGSHQWHGDPTYDTLISWNWQSGGDVRHDFNDKPMLQSSQIPAVGVRRLMPIECERLQGFPDGWTDGQSDSARYRQLGNTVAIPVVEWIAKRIVKAEICITLPPAYETADLLKQLIG